MPAPGCDGLDVAALWPSFAQVSGAPIPEIARDEADALEGGWPDAAALRDGH